MKHRIETPMYFAAGFSNGLIKQFPESSTNNDEVTKGKDRAKAYFDKGNEVFTSIESMRKANNSDRTQTPEGRTVSTYQHAQKKLAELQKTYNNLPDLSAVAKQIDDEISDTLEKTADSAYGREARQRISSMPKSERASFVNQAIHRNDLKTAAYALGTPGYFSGLSDEQHSQLREQYKSHVFSEEKQAIKALQSMHEHVEKAKVATSKVVTDLNAQARLAGLDQNEKVSELTG
ncbi:MAG: hypothetical protein WD097_07780 [Balneolales bacterium]